MNKLYHLTDHLKTHTLTHRGVNDYECITCYKRLFHNVDLKTHRLYNTEVKTIMHYMSEENILYW